MSVSSPLKIRTQPTQPVARPAGRGDLLSLPLIDALVQAARGDDRARFDKCFDECFEELWTHAFRTTGNPKEAEALTEQILFDVIRSR
jgi:hypothetical protein